MKRLLQRMTTEEKIGQLLQLSADFFADNQAVITGPMKAHKLTIETVYNAGSVLGISGAARVRKIQTDYLAHSRLKIPLLFMADVVHGYRTIFPIPLALGGSFSPQVMQQAAEVAAAESAAGGVHVTFAPMVDLVRDPRWGRVMESTGEDPYLNSVMAKAAVTGFQGLETLDQDHIAACVKHFAAYGAPEAGREYNTVDISEWRFREQYLPAYAAAIESQALLVMTSFNTLFGVPATANQRLMRQILRDELQFNGVLISDWDAIGELVHHGVAGDLSAAADLALKAGVDIDMMSFAYAKYLERVSKLDQQTAQLIDESVLRILELKQTLGLFDDPYRGISEDREQKIIQSEANLHAAQIAAEQSIVLLKNRQQVLPITPEKRIALIGPLADTGDILGSWSWSGKAEETPHLRTTLEQAVAHVQVARGSDYHMGNDALLHEAEAIARDADLIIAAVGLPSDESGEATSMTDIRLPESQRKLLRLLASLGKPLVTVVFTGRPMDLTEVDALSDAVLLAWFPGSRGAQALTNVLTGVVNPSGKLPMTFPRSVGQVPLYYNYYRTGRPINHDQTDDENKYLSKYIDESNDPLYPFGFGLSYADFELSDLTTDTAILKPESTVNLQVRVVNHSNVPGQTVVQWYIHQEVGETVRPVKQLISFEKVMVPAQGIVTCSLALTPDMLASMHMNLTESTDEGNYQIMVGLNADDIQQQEIQYAENKEEHNA
ncbi:beta-glucosidase BglX [Lacticaseibacillus saniviri]